MLSVSEALGSLVKNLQDAEKKERESTKPITMVGIREAILQQDATGKPPPSVAHAPDRIGRPLSREKPEPPALPPRMPPQDDILVGPPQKAPAGVASPSPDGGFSLTFDPASWPPDLTMLHSVIFPLKETVRIGRSRDNDLVLDNITVSRHHAMIRRAEDEYLLSDLNTANGVLVNNRPILDDYILEDGDAIRIGGIVCTFSRNRPAP